MEVEQSVGVVAAFVTSTEDLCPVAEPTERSELIGVVEAVAEVTVSSAAKQDKFPGAGRLYEEGKHPTEFVVLDEKYEDVGGFSVLKTQASLYKEIWLKYGHIASSQVLTDLYSSQVAVVTEIMTSIEDMNRCHLEEVSSELIDLWEKKIKVAEKLEFNISWLRESLEDIKKIFAGEKKLQDTLVEQVQANAQVFEAEQQLVFANDGLNMAKERLFALETKISPLLKERQNFLTKCGGRLLPFACGKSTSGVISPVLKDEMPIEEPIDNNSKTVPFTGIPASIPRRTRTQTTTISPANEAKRKFSGDSAVVGNGHHSEKKPKTSKDGCEATSQSITGCPMPSRGSLSPEITSTPNAKQLFTEDEILAVLLQQPIITTRELVGKFRSRLNTEEEKLAFSDVMRGICMIHTKADGTRYVILTKK
ncbi:hypothetical protein MKW94_020509 [Papaver nudicaule]|uniref:Transcription initiation factor IIF subunit alpha n=1 Tax=Papaver nudicaule TaxID=74823 RepID=A0AA41V9G4_PAPNU|nr:hypothetical protein [Papaver nudicaule]